MLPRSDATPPETGATPPEPDAADEPAPRPPEPAAAEGSAGDPVADVPTAQPVAEPDALDAPAPAAADSTPPAVHDPGTESDEGAGAGRQQTPGTVAELIAATLRAAGVRVAFTVPGESFLTLLDALADAGIRIVTTRHESAAAFAAEAHGQLTGRPAACLGTRAVGAANLAIGIHTAYADSTPMFVLVGQVSSDLRGREAFQEADLVGTIGALAAWAAELDDPAAARHTLEEAVHRALDGRPGPVLLALPEDVLAAPLPEGTEVPAARPHPAPPEPEDVRAVLHLLAGAERPVILAGAGVLRARCSNDLVRLAELLQVPVVASWRRGDVIPNDHPLYLGMTGLSSPATVRDRLEAADAILVLGSRLNEATSYEYRIPRPGQRWIHVDVEPRLAAVGDGPAPERAVRADARAFVRAALARLKNAVLLAGPIAARQQHNPEDRAAWEAATVVDRTPWTGPGVHPGRVIADLHRLLPEDGIVTTDAGNFAGWLARGFRFRRPGTFLGPTSGAMGYGLPAAIAAGILHRDRRVVAVVGDGGLGMTLAELETAVREDIHLTVLVFDNEQYGTIRMHQDREGSTTPGTTTLGPVDFAAVARACGARGTRVESQAAFEPALRTALAGSGTTLIHLILDRRWVSVDDVPAVDPSGRPTAE
jgi:acetolactate synthase I/II/III large subunit